MNQKKNLSKNQLIYKSMLTVTNKDILSIQTQIINKFYGFSEKDFHELYVILAGLQKNRKIWFNNQKTNIIDQIWKLLFDRLIEVKENLSKEELLQLYDFSTKIQLFYNCVYNIFKWPNIYTQDERLEILNNELQSLKTIMLQSEKNPLESKFLYEIHNLTVSEKYKEYKDIVFEISFINGESVIFDYNTILSPIEFYNFCHVVLRNIKICYVDFWVTDTKNDLRFIITSLNSNNDLYKKIQDEIKPFNIDQLAMETYTKLGIAKSNFCSRHILLYNKFLKSQMVILSKNQIVEFRFDSFGRLLSIDYEQIDLNDLTIIKKYLKKYFLLGYECFYHINSTLLEKKITENFNKIFIRNNKTKIELLDVKKKFMHPILTDHYIVDFLTSHTFNLHTSLNEKVTSLFVDISGSNNRYIKKFYITLFNSLWIAYIDKILSKKIKTSLNLCEGDIVQLFKPDKNCVSAEVNYNYIVHKVVNLESEQHNESKKLVILVDPNRTDVEFLININVLKLIKEVENKQEILEKQKYKPSRTNSKFSSKPTIDEYLNKTGRAIKPSVESVSNFEAFRKTIDDNPGYMTQGFYDINTITTNINPVQTKNSSDTIKIKQDEKTDIEKNIIFKRRRSRRI